MKVCRDLSVDSISGLNIALTMRLALYRSSKRRLRKASLRLRYAIRTSKRSRYGLRIKEIKKGNILEGIRKLTAENRLRIQSLARDANVSYDHFIRTTDKAHADTVRHFWVRADRFYERRDFGC